MTEPGIRKQSAFTLLNRVPSGKFNGVHQPSKKEIPMQYIYTFFGEESNFFVMSVDGRYLSAHFPKGVPHEDKMR